MQKYEHKIIYSGKSDPYEFREKALNDFGLDGWHVVGVRNTDNSIEYTLSRKIPNGINES